METKNTKPHVNVGTLGHVNHGKSTFIAAIAFAHLSRRSSLNEASLPVLADFDPKSGIILGHQIRGEERKDKIQPKGNS